MRVVVCGDRRYGDLSELTRESPEWDRVEAEYRHVMNCLDQILHPSDKITDDIDTWLPKDVTVISGGARGVDAVGEDWAVVNWTGLEIYEAEWTRYKKAAGPIRNRRMLEEGKPDLVIAFLKPDSRGTKDMIEQSTRAGVRVIVVDI